MSGGMGLSIVMQFFFWIFQVKSVPLTSIVLMKIETQVLQ